MKDISVDYLSKHDTFHAYILNSIFDGVYIVDKERKIIFWNKGAEEITGYSAREVLGRRCSDNILNHIDENGNLLCQGACPLIRAFKTEKNIKEKVYPMNKSGNRFPVMTHVAPLRDKSGNVISAIEIFRDITKEEEFRILQEKFNKLIKKYVSSVTFDEVIEQAHSGKDIKSNMLDLTILYLDIVDFTSYSEKHSHEEVVELLNNVFGFCELITKECHGDIDKFIGDAIMAVFVDANDAVLGGKKILKVLYNFNKTRRKEGEKEISIRIGINSGIVIQGEIGTLERKDLTVIGDVVNTASRIQNISEKNSIFISESAVSRLNSENKKLFKFYDKLKVKGKKDKLNVYKY